MFHKELLYSKYVQVVPNHYCDAPSLPFLRLPGARSAALCSRSLICASVFAASPPNLLLAAPNDSRIIETN